MVHIDLKAEQPAPILLRPEQLSAVAGGINPQPLPPFRLRD